LAAGKGVIRDVVTVASDEGAPLAEKMALYGAAATMTPHDRGRLDSMIQAVMGRAGKPVAVRGRPSPPTNGGTPLGALESSLDALQDEPAPVRLRAVSAPRRRASKSPNTRTASAEAKVRRAYVPGMSISALAKASGVSMSAASKWRKVIRAEQDEQEQVAQ
jgi:hypothetical protein